MGREIGVGTGSEANNRNHGRLARTLLHAFVDSIDVLSVHNEPSIDISSPTLPFGSGILNYFCIFIPDSLRSAPTPSAQEFPEPQADAVKH